MHGALGCSELGEVAEGETAMFGYAMDGHPVHSPYPEGEEPDDLDECNGHSTEELGYHYHANSAEQNQVIECLVGQTVAGADAGDEVVLASNTSSIPIMKLAMATTRPEQVIGLHFFNPVPVLPLLEVVTSLLTSERTTATATRFASEVLGKRVINSQDRAGFIVNALLIPYLLSAIRMMESGFASAEDIDTGMVEGCAHPMGPLALTDLIGLDTTMAVAESLYEEFKEPLYAAPPLLSRMVDAGLLGRKAGRGFYEYAS